MTTTPKPNGGPAFPFQTIWHTHEEEHGGLSQRQYYAAHAPDMPGWFGHEFSTDMERFIAWRWAYADAMIAAREAGQ